ncbi:MAG: hypothetical protein K0M63_07260 [Weeksellaceae bacterium]|nr:hypothetical protein [Weeksellaceae bacterium]
MDSKDVVLLVWDEEEHFLNNINNLGKDSFKKITRIDSRESFEHELGLLNNNFYIHLVVHIFYSDIRGIQQFISSGIREKYPLLETKFISDGTLQVVKSDVVNKEFSEQEEQYINMNLQKYHKVRSSIENGELNLYTIHEHLENGSQVSEDNFQEDNLQVDYIIITALEQDEMEKVLPLIEKIKKIPNDKHLIELGFFKSKPEKSVIYASQLTTGMIDASILATELIVRFDPKFVIMTGVMGGKPDDTNLGDVVISTKVFTIDKGKVTDDEFRKEIEATSTTSSFTTEITRHRREIIAFISDSDPIHNIRVQLHFEPIACVRSVIDNEGFFVENISTVDRKAIGLEMESYGIARACEIVNGGRTIPMIIKSVMDNTQDKTDGAKQTAAWTSAKVLEYIIANDII